MAKSVGFEIEIKDGSGKIPRNHIYIAVYIASPMLRGQGRHTPPRASDWASLLKECRLYGVDWWTSSMPVH